MSGDIASRLRAVSTKVSPLSMLDVLPAIFNVSALSRFSAISKDVRVRVLASKNKFTTVLPRSVGTFLMRRVPISFMASAVSKINKISSALRSSILRRCFERKRDGVRSDDPLTVSGTSTGMLTHHLHRHPRGHHSAHPTEQLRPPRPLR